MMSPSQASQTLLRPLSERFPNVDAAMAEIARITAISTLPKGTIHVISDIHGEDQKLRHVINNASGSLRPIVEKRFSGRLPQKEFQELLTLIFYPAEVTEQLAKENRLAEDLKAYAVNTLSHLFELARFLATRYSLQRASAVFAAEYRELLYEMLQEPAGERKSAFLTTIVDELVRRGRIWELIHVTGRLVRNLAIDELVIGGDCWDRGPRSDRVVDYLRQQPNVSFVWGNHDVAWFGAAMGHGALICNVLRLSLRYRRMEQVAEGYSIPWTPLEHLARTVYADDPAVHFKPNADGMRPIEVVARMQKAAAILQFKLEGQMLARHPEWRMDHRRLLHQIDHDKGTVEVDGVIYPLRDKLFPTIDPSNPYQLTAEEETCFRRIRRSFLNSQKLREQMCYLVSHGSMYLIRDNHLIFHGCVVVDERGEFLSMPINETSFKGQALFHELEKLFARVIDGPKEGDLDVLWYLWSGPCSPLFGKDRIATFERDFIAEKTSHHEHKNPYFTLINEVGFCDKVLREFGVDPALGLIVNGHVPVKIEKGESPLKRSGKAITIDGAFSEAYGDHGYTLVLEADRTYLALHHQFDSVEAAIRDGIDIIPSVTDVRVWDKPRRTADTERGAELRTRIKLLERLIEAYENNELRQSSMDNNWRTNSVP